MTINDFISIYLAAKAEQAAADKASRAAKARAEAAAAEIKKHAAGRASFDTDAYTVSITQKARIILDQPKLVEDFPNIKNLDQYGTESKYDVITALARQQAESLTA